MPQAPQEDENHLDNLEQSLYSRNRQDSGFKEQQLHKQSSLGVRSDWGDANDPSDSYEAIDTKPHSFFKRFFFFSIIFFLIAVGVALFVYFRGANVISSNNIDIAVSGPVSIGAGQELDLNVAITNQNNIDLSDVTLQMQYPDGTRVPSNITQVQTNTEDDLGPVASGGVITKKVSAVLFGAQNAQEQITLLVDYTVKNSSATYEKQKTITVSITSVPVTVTISSPTEVNSDQDMEMDVQLASNSSTVINNVLLQGDYGFGFTFASSTPSPSANQDVWNIGTLQPGEKKTIKIFGAIDAQDGEDRAFNFAVGIADPNNPNTIQVQFLTAAQTISIQKPFIGTDLTLNGSENAVVTTQPGQTIQGNINWVNNLPTPVTGATVTLTLSGPLISKTSVEGDQGFYDSLANTISWNETTNPELATVQAGDTGSLSFSLASLPMSLSNLSLFQNGDIDLTVSVTGETSDDPNVSGQTIMTSTKDIHFNTALSLVPKVVYSTGPFVNTGPIPPRAEKTTTYTVTWDVTNTFNDVSNAEVTATLPSYVKWLGQVRPSTETITYDPTSGDITWDPGNIPAKTGFGNPPREVSFQISITPSVSQVTTAPLLVGSQTITGTDNFTNVTVTQNKADLNTVISSDPHYTPASGNVTN